MAMPVWLKSKNVEKSLDFIGISEKHGVEDGEGKKQKQQLSRQADKAEVGKRHVNRQPEAA